MLRGERGGQPSTLEDTGLHQGLIQNTHIQSNSPKVQWDSSAVFFLKLPLKIKKKKKLFFKDPRLPWWLSGKMSAYQCRRCGSAPWIGKIPWRRKWRPAPVFLPGNPTYRGAWWATACGVTKSRTQLSNSARTTIHDPVWQCLGCTGGLLLGVLGAYSGDFGNPGPAAAS